MGICVESGMTGAGIWRMRWLEKAGCREKSRIYQGYGVRGQDEWRDHRDERTGRPFVGRGLRGDIGVSSGRVAWIDCGSNSD